MESALTFERGRREECGGTPCHVVSGRLQLRSYVVLHDNYLHGASTSHKVV
jgi:hypothetical protein